MSDDHVTIEVDGQSIEARKGSMLIEATDAAGIYIPRFCYHKHLSVAANCRMCLVEVERAPKPLPACATPVMDGMKVSTKSPYAIAAQRSTMEFLLINHPLDCPICDQGGECELQDLAMGYGGDVSRYSERKRVVRDKDIGPLVQTDMTRCIHCTRCVRFGEEIAGLRELGATGRGEDMEIGTYIAKSMSSELSGNVIDLCPVGALTSKPYRYSARAWELQQRDGVAPHDCLGSNVHFHIKGSKVKRVVPKDNSAVNETWLSDRDRFSYEALNSDDRLLSPRIKRDGQWQDCDWDTALSSVALRLGELGASVGGESIGAIASPSSTTEEFYLLQRLVRELGGKSIDHRPRQIDFSADKMAPLAPSLGVSLAQLECADVILIVGANPRLDQPLINHRIRKAALAGATVLVVNSVDYDFNFPVAQSFIVPPSQITSVLGGIAKVTDSSNENPEPVLAGLDSFIATEAHESIASKLVAARSAVVMIGNFAQRHADFGQIYALATRIANATSSRLAQLTDGANSAGGWLAGAIPHRGPGGRKLVAAGLDADGMFDSPLAAYILLGIEPEFDCLRPQKVIDALCGAYVIAFSAFTNASLEASADVLLPIATYAENEGSYVNALGQWQEFSPAVRAPGEARPAWKVIRVLGAQLSLPGFDAINVADVTGDIASLCEGAEKPNCETAIVNINQLVSESLNAEAVVEIPLYSIDALVRHGLALQSTPLPKADCVFLNGATAKQLGLISGEQAVIKGDHSETVMTVAIDDKVGDGSYLVYVAQPGASAYSGAQHMQISKA
ncbi:MAG: NADH-quinone oxidoreductase subunit NuoG [Proteobacteria bacterium]|nr:NADH-quinone oxidoreductase subunit NuoG [Pseudomonadota bacterium]